MKNLFKSMIPVFALALMISLVGCESKEDQDLFAGQVCLDHATNEVEANVCVTKVLGYESAQAYLIRCSANFISQGLTGSRFVEATNKMQNDGSVKSDADKTSTMFSYFVFANPNPNHSAEVTYLNCQKAGNESILKVAALVKMSTILARAVGGGTIPTSLDPNSGAFNPDSMAAAIQGLDPATVDTATLGAAAQVASTNYCQEGSKYKSEPVCVSLVKAVNSSSDLSSLGEELINVLKNL